jgi:hypothetical protein
MAERRRYADAVSYICHLNLEKAPIISIDILDFTANAIPQEDRDRFLATLKTKSINGDQVVFDPEVFCIFDSQIFYQCGDCISKSG